MTEGGSKGGKAIAIAGDVSKPEEIHRLFSEIKKPFGKVDVLVNNAGTYEFAPPESIKPEHWITGQVIVAAGGKRM